MLRSLILISLSLGSGSLLAQPSAGLSETSHQEIMDLITVSNEKRDEVLNDPEFHAFVAHQKAQVIEHAKRENPDATPPSRDLYVFVSFSMGEQGLKAALKDARQYGAQVVLKGFKEENLQKTVEAVTTLAEKTRYGLIIDPELFEVFQVEKVPTIILSNRSRASEDGNSTPLHDRISGNVTVQYALERFSESGDLKSVASSCLKRGKAQ